jgi:hypothetical protein
MTKTHVVTLCEVAELIRILSTVRHVVSSLVIQELSSNNNIDSRGRRETFCAGYLLDTVCKGEREDVEALALAMHSVQ